MHRPAGAAVQARGPSTHGPNTLGGFTKSRFFSTPAGVLATGSQPLEGLSRRLRWKGKVDGGGRGVHLLGLDELHIPSTDGVTFFVLVVAQSRSAQLRASISREYFAQRFQVVCTHHRRTAHSPSPCCRGCSHYLLLDEARLRLASSSLKQVILQDFGLCESW